jgi:hypothetical protein
MMVVVVPQREDTPGRAGLARHLPRPDLVEPEFSLQARHAEDRADGEFGLTALREKAIAATRQLAKRQLTWLRSWKDTARFDCVADDLGERRVDPYRAAAILAERAGSD